MYLIEMSIRFMGGHISEKSNVFGCIGEQRWDLTFLGQCSKCSRKIPLFRASVFNDGIEYSPREYSVSYVGA